MNIPTVIASTGLAWAVFTTLKSMGQKGQFVLTIAGFIAAWGICATTVYRIISSLRIIAF